MLIKLDATPEEIQQLFSRLVYKNYMDIKIVLIYSGNYLETIDT